MSDSVSGITCFVRSAMYVLRGASAYVCLFSQFPHAAFGSDLRLRAVDDGHWLVHTTHTVLCTSTASERTSERARVRQKRQREKIRERKRVLLDENCRTSKPLVYHPQPKKFLFFLSALNGQK